MNTDHVQCYTCELSCNNCGLAPTFEPMPAATLSDVIRGFLLMHRRCEKPAEPSKQVELFDALAAKEANHTRVIQDPIAEAAEAMGYYDADPGIDGMSDEPDPETDPPGHDLPELTDLDDPFGARYPRAHDHVRLRADLDVVLQDQGGSPSLEQLRTYPVGSTAYDEIAHWCRMQLAIMNRKENPDFEVYLPATPQPMPRSLVKLTKKARGARPLSSPRKRRSTMEAP